MGRATRLHVILTAVAMVVAALVAGGFRYASATRADAPTGTLLQPEAGTSAMADADGQGSMGDGQSAPAGTIDGTTGTGDGAPHAVAQCWSIVEEVERRDGLGLIDWEGLDEPIDPDEVDEDTIELAFPPVDGRVADPGERLRVERFDEPLDLAVAEVGDLLDGLWACEEAGLVDDSDEPASTDPDL